MSDDIIAQAIPRDRRFADLQLAIATEADQRDSPVFRAFLGYLRADAELAMSELSETSPLDSKAIGLLSSRVRAYATVKRMIETILTRGKIAEAEIRQQDTQYSDDE